ncbi:MAG: hypothetical protein L0177_20390 [Chloroflexi bacterium]|nr:hypothetical protein [Chloroflexota bacterium]
MDEKAVVQKSPGKAEAEDRKRPFTEPRLTFIEPKLERRGKIESVTGFIGSFSP